MLPVLQVLGQLRVFGLLSALLRRLALRRKEENAQIKRAQPLVPGSRWAWLSPPPQPTTRGSVWYSASSYGGGFIGLGDISEEWK